MLLGSLTAFGPLSIDMYLPALPSMSHDLHAGPSVSQLTLTAVMLGLAFGQSLAGPVSDTHGRRPPLLLGLLLFAVASLMCALAPNIATLLAFRFVQGAAGAAGIVIARAVVRDVHSGAAAARLYALLMMIMGAVPIAAPIAGGQLLHVTDWRGIFVALAAIGAALFGLTWWLLPETLAVPDRFTEGWRASSRVFGRLLRERQFVGFAAVLGLSFGVLAGYLAGSPFVLQVGYDLSPQVYSFVFAVNVVGLVALSQLGRVLVERFGSRRLVRAGLLLGAVGGAGTLACTAVHAPLALLLIALFLTVSASGLVSPNVTALLLAGHARVAGSASGLAGLSQFVCGAAVAPLVGLGGSHAELPMGLVLAGAAAGGLLAYRIATFDRPVLPGRPP